MGSATQQKFYVGVLTRDGDTVAHGLSTHARPFGEGEPQHDEATPKKDDLDIRQRVRADSFAGVFHDFVATLESYRRFMPFTLNLAPKIAGFMAEREIAEFAKSHGIIRADLSQNGWEVYELDSIYFSAYMNRHERVIAATGGAHLLPEVMIIGLISAYDSFLASLLRVVIGKHEELILTSQKQLTYKELLEFKSTEHARSTLIDREIESVIRKSHDEQFNWMIHNFSTPLKTGLTVWPQFIELCERRNLFTHTGGIVSDQYLKICQEHKCDMKNITAGQKLSVPPDYCRAAVDTVYEIGLKLRYVLWRKFDKHEAKEADVKFNGRCMELIDSGAYALAELLLYSVIS